MSDYTFPCEFCATPLTVPEEQIGSDVACSQCGRTVTVPRQQVVLKLKDAKRKSVAPSAPSRMENLSNLTETSAFGGERAAYLAQRRHVALGKQLLVGLSLLVSLVVVVGGTWRYLANKRATELRLAAEEEQRDQENARRRGIWTETPARNRDAQAISPLWTLSDEGCYGLLLVLHALSANRQDVSVRFKDFARADEGVGGMQVALYERVGSEADVTSACDTLTGLALGLHGSGADVKFIASFRDISLKKIEMSAARLLNRP